MTAGGTSGGCLCGAVRYRVDGALRQAIACHCRQCRKTSGHFAAATQADADAVTVTGEVRWFASSPGASRGFCPICGSNLFWKETGSDRISIWAGSINGATGLTLVGQLHPESKGDYYDLPDVPFLDQARL